MDISLMIALLIWAVVDFYVAKKVRENNPGLSVEPIFYALGAILFGGIWPLLFLGGKYLLWKNRKNNE